MRTYVLLALFVFIVACTQAETTIDTTGAQQVTAKVVGSSYEFTPASVTAQETVVITFDPDELPGCSRVVTIPEYGIKQFIDEQNNKVAFVPQGDVKVACSMNMYTGTLKVE